MDRPVKTFAGIAYVFWAVAVFLLLLEPIHIFLHFIGAHGHHDFIYIIGLWQTLALSTAFTLVGSFFASGAHGTHAERLVDAITGWIGRVFGGNSAPNT